MQNKNKRIAAWLYIGVAMIVVQVLLGGITRLTGSGLSITEWKPIMGALPPLNAADWQIAFEKYQAIGQFKYINADFSLADFKFIFFWEWLHRNWARLIGFVFFIPFLYFLISNQIKKEWIGKFVFLFFIGGLQGLVGWIMVASGLNDDDLFVNYFKLATHFITAMLALVVVYWFALEFSNKQIFTLEKISQQGKKIQTLCILVIILVSIQLCYGAFMAGLKAAAAAPTWPSINGAFAPEGMWNKSFYSHPITVHFVHRNLAYVLASLIVYLSLQCRRIVQNQTWTSATRWPLFFVVIQIALGVSTVLSANHPARNAMGLFEWSAQLHQLVALCLLLSLVHVYFLIKKPIPNNPFALETE
jgi:heme a synthase